MATEVGKLLVKIDAETAGVRKGLADVKKQTSETTQKIKDMGVRLAALYGTIQGASGLTKNISQFENLAITLETVLGGAKQAKAGMEFIKEFARTTPFAVETLTKAIIQLSSAGIKPTAKDLTIFGDAAAIATNKTEAFETMLRVVSESASGGLEMIELDMIQEKGLPVFEIIEEKLGVLRKDVTELGRSAFGAQKIIEAMKEGFDERFGGGMAKSADTIETIFSNLGETFVELQLAMGEMGLTRSIKDLGIVLERLLIFLTPLAKVLGAGLAGAIQAIVIPLELFLNFMNALNAVMKVLGEWLVHNFNPAINTLREKLLRERQLLFMIISQKQLT